ncbi:MAG: YfhO family protein [Anaerolineae bacterium]|nr:YfhO family protein [Anaerolineae bacterium]
MSENRWRPQPFLLEWLVLILVVYLYSQAVLLDFNPQQLQQTGEHNESATLPILAEIGLTRYRQLPLWNPYMLTGFPHAGDPVNHFWNPLATLPVLLWGGINGMKVSVFLSLVAAALGQWVLAHVLGVRGIFRLWAGLTYALAGGLALFWRLGWYELLVGIAWFPWCFAALWYALHHQDRRSLVLTALAIFMVVSTGGGYYPLYLGVCLAVLSGMAWVWQPPEKRRLMVTRGVIIVALSVGLLAVIWLPLTDGLRYTVRDAPPDYPQRTSQPIPYALFNYVVSDPAWFGTDVLGKGLGFGWFYLGVLPLLALAFTPWLYGRFPWRRRFIVAWAALLLVLLLWHANRHTPVQYLYDWFPALYIFRLPNRLLVVASAPLVALAALTLQGWVVWARRWWRGLDVAVTSPHRQPTAQSISLVRVLNLIVLLILFLAGRDLYTVNKGFAMTPQTRNQNARQTLTWLKQQDDSLYYVNIGGDRIYWDWMAYAYELEMPVINFRYNRGVATMGEQYGPGSPFNAQPKYVLSGHGQAGPPGAQSLYHSQGVTVWYRPDVLPFAFATEGIRGPVNRSQVQEQAVRLDGPNRVVVTGAAANSSQHLIVLISDYPGWRLRIDGKQASVAPVNGYLGAKMEPGEHTYTFTFRPLKHDIGLVISLLTLLFCGYWLRSEVSGNRTE